MATSYSSICKNLCACSLHHLFALSADVKSKLCNFSFWSKMTALIKKKIEAFEDVMGKNTVSKMAAPQQTLSYVVARQLTKKTIRGFFVSFVKLWQNWPNMWTAKNSKCNNTHSFLPISSKHTSSIKTPSLAYQASYSPNFALWLLAIPKTKQKKKITQSEIWFNGGY